LSFISGLSAVLTNGVNCSILVLKILLLYNFCNDSNGLENLIPAAALYKPVNIFIPLRAPDHIDASYFLAVVGSNLPLSSRTSTSQMLSFFFSA
jgi:hypothetical protein